MSSINAPLLVGLLATACAATACTRVTAVPLAALPLAKPAQVEPSLRSARRFAVCRFTDERGEIFTRRHASSDIPVVSLIHRGGVLEYPDHAGAIRAPVGENKIGVSIGGLDEALPQLLADTLRKSGAAPATSSCTDLAPDVQPDYLITGRLRAARFRTDESVVLAITLGLVGVPFIFTRLDLDFEVTLFAAADPTRPIWQGTFQAEDKRAGGMYYGQPSVHASLVRALERTLPSAAAKIATAAFAHEARVAR